jgi:hypothetical protein
MAAHVAAEPSDPLGLEHLVSAPSRIREECIGQRDYADLVVLRLRRPGEAEKLLRQLMRGSGKPELSGLTGFRSAS